jgi:hypothetical protein
MLNKILIVLISSISFYAHAEDVKSEAIRSLVAAEVEAISTNWYSQNDDVGHIWVAPYSDSKDEYFFEVKEWKTKNHMVVEASFPCGSEFDESSFPGTCDVDVIKDVTKNEWVAIIDSLDRCFCEAETSNN